MNVDSSMCASSDHASHWDQIDGDQCRCHVRRLQARIVKATQEGRWGKVETLQWLLTHSFSGQALVVKRVTENQGKNTPGVDRVTWRTPTAKLKAIADPTLPQGDVEEWQTLASKGQFGSVCG
jgi:RNA-directed DNA polymerase